MRYRNHPTRASFTQAYDFKVPVLAALAVISLVFSGCALVKEASLDEEYNQFAAEPVTAPTAEPRPTLFAPRILPTLPAFLCEDDRYALLDDDVVVNQVRAGEIFTQIWRLENTGKCLWNEAYRTVVVAGGGFGAPQSAQAYFLPGDSYPTLEIGGWESSVAEVLPGEAASLALVLIAPETPGLYHGQWALENPAGVRLNPTLTLAIEVTAAPDDFPEPTWSGHWILRDPLQVDTHLLPAFFQQERGRLSGFYYDDTGRLLVIFGDIDEETGVVDGEYGDPRQLRDTGIPFRWRQEEQSGQFRGIYWAGTLFTGAWCGARPPNPLPDPCLLD